MKFNFFLFLLSFLWANVLIAQDKDQLNYTDSKGLKQGLWRKTNEQDGHFSAINHRGIANDGYVQGPYALEEKLVDGFKAFYVSRAKAALAQVQS